MAYSTIARRHDSQATNCAFCVADLGHIRDFSSPFFCDLIVQTKIIICSGRLQKWHFPLLKITESATSQLMVGLGVSFRVDE